MLLSFKSYSNIYLRIFVILLCCVFVFQLFSVKAYAAISAATAAAISVIASVLIGIGVRAFSDLGESTGAFENLTLAIQNALKPPDVVSDWIVDLYYDGKNYFASEDFVNDVKDYLIGNQTVFTSGDLVFSPVVSCKIANDYMELMADNGITAFIARYSAGNRYYLTGYGISTSSRYSYTFNGSSRGPYEFDKRIGSYGYFRLFEAYNWNEISYYSGLPVVDFGNFSSKADFVSYFENSLSTGELLNQGVYTDLPLDVSGVPNYNLNPSYGLSEYYPAWKTIVVPGTDTVGFTVVVGDTIDDVLGLTQQQVQSGAIDVPGTGEGTDTGTIAQWLENIWTGIQALPQSIATSITDSLSSKIEPGQLELNLTEFFPFCIPFDIYEFFAILAADPVAPVFEWTIPVPQLGTSYDFEIDLSAWDSVARLFRTMELLAFCVGLAFFTRDKFTRG